MCIVPGIVLLWDNELNLPRPTLKVSLENQSVWYYYFSQESEKRQNMATSKRTMRNLSYGIRHPLELFSKLIKDSDKINESTYPYNLHDVFNFLVTSAVLAEWIQQFYSSKNSPDPFSLKENVQNGLFQSNHTYGLLIKIVYQINMEI